MKCFADIGLRHAPHSEFLAWVQFTAVKKGKSQPVDNESQDHSMVVKDSLIPLGKGSFLPVVCKPIWAD